MLNRLFSRIAHSLVNGYQFTLSRLVVYLWSLLDVEVARAAARTLLGVRDLSPEARYERLDQISNFSAYDRDAWVEAKLASIPVGARVLDAGAGECRYKKFLGHTSYSAQDFAQYMGSESGPLKEVWSYGKLDYVCDITSIPVDSNFFDVVLCTEVLEHVPDPISALRELVRVVSADGRLLITVPLSSGVHQEPFHFYGGFSPYFFQHHLNEMGVDLLEIKPLGGLFKHTAQEIVRCLNHLDGKQELPPLADVMMREWLPTEFSNLEEEFFVEQFTVGYLIEARKRNS
jgi:SAM-dependent methyltransferase